MSNKDENSSIYFKTICKCGSADVEVTANMGGVYYECFSCGLQVNRTIHDTDDNGRYVFEDEIYSE